MIDDDGGLIIEPWPAPACVAGAPGNVWVLRCPTCGRIEDRWPKASPSKLKSRSCCKDWDQSKPLLSFPEWQSLPSVEMLPHEISAGEIAERTRRRSERLAQTYFDELHSQIHRLPGQHPEKFPTLVRRALRYLPYVRWCPPMGPIVDDWRDNYPDIDWEDDGRGDYTIATPSGLIWDIANALAKVELIPALDTWEAVSESLITLRDALTSDQAPRLRLVD